MRLMSVAAVAAVLIPLVAAQPTVAGGVLSEAAGPRTDRAPARPPAQIAGLVGEYGPPGAQLIIFERDGALFAEGRGLSAAPLRRRSKDAYALDAGGGSVAAPALVFRREGHGRATALSMGGQWLARRDLGAEVEAGIRAGVRGDPDRLRAAALAASPPVEQPRRPADLVDLTTVVPGIRLDIRYAGANNFMGIVLYERSGAYLQRPAAEALGRVQRSLRAKGYGLLVHDGYRPWFVTKMFWDATPEAYRKFVANPAQGSRHNRGCAVDLTLYDLKTGEVVEMPGRYDELSDRSNPEFPGGTSRQRWHRDLLRREMEKEGFTVYAEEWWHFDYKDWREYGIGTRTFTELARADGA